MIGNYKNLIIRPFAIAVKMKTSKNNMTALESLTTVIIINKIKMEAMNAFNSPHKYFIQ